MILHSLNQIMGEKIQSLSYSKSKPTAVEVSRHEFWIVQGEENRKDADAEAAL